MIRQLSILVVVLLLAVTPALAAEANLDVALLSYNPSPVQPGQTFDLFLEVTNNGDAANDAKLEVIAEYPFELLDTQDVERAKQFTVSGLQRLQFQIKVAPGANDGLAPLRVTFARSQDAPYQEREFDINIQTFNARVGLQEVRQEPERLRPGEEGELILLIRNFDDQPLRNIDIHLDFTDSYDVNANMENSLAVQSMINARLEEVNRKVASGQSPLSGATPMMVSGGKERIPTAFTAVAPSGGATRVQVPDLEPQSEIEVRIPIRALPGATPDIYAVPLYVNYNDEDNNPFHARIEIPILIDMEPNVFVELLSTDLRSTDFAGKATISVANRALTEMRFVKIELVESEDYRLLTAPSEVYLGSLSPGANANATFEILAEEDDLALPVRVTFLNSFNEEVVLDRTIELEIINRFYYRDMPFEMAWAWIVAALVMLALTLYFVRRK
ncbi:hypothetical protein GOV07_01780 [Candidatus Woesearchaeota archaeon]|nr:hypothetical protein [Candidatus Woesearchaeota archaeon]